MNILYYTRNGVTLTAEEQEVFNILTSVTSANVTLESTDKNATSPSGFDVIVIGDGVTDFYDGWVHFDSMSRAIIQCKTTLNGSLGQSSTLVKKFHNPEYSLSAALSDLGTAEDVIFLSDILIPLYEDDLGNVIVARKPNESIIYFGFSAFTASTPIEVKDILKKLVEDVGNGSSVEIIASHAYDYPYENKLTFDMARREQQELFWRNNTYPSALKTSYTNDDHSVGYASHPDSIFKTYHKNAASTNYKISGTVSRMGIDFKHIDVILYADPYYFRPVARVSADPVTGFYEFRGLVDEEYILIFRDRRNQYNLGIRDRVRPEVSLSPVSYKLP